MKFTAQRETSFEVPSVLEEIPSSTQKIFDFFSKLPLDESDNFDIRLSFEEVLINGMKHGNKFNPKLTVKVKLAYNDEALYVAVKDHGPGVDFSLVKDPTDLANIEAYSGRGVFLVKNLMDYLGYDSNGNGVEFVKVYAKNIKNQKR